MDKHFSQGEIIFKEGDVGESFYDIIEGSVGVYTDYGTDVEKKLTEIQPGHIVGELALIDAYPRSATAVALSDVTADEVSVDDLKSYFSTKPDRITFLIKELSERITRLSTDYSEACETLKDIFPEDENRKPSIADKIKKFAASYIMVSKSSKISVETMKELVQTGHDDGTTKNVETFKKGTIIFREGEPGKCMYDIFTGSVNVYKDYGTPSEKLLTTVGANKF